ncbi:diflavin oxidoreductase [Gynurincola endophyticus]|uniref:diflavin oxidoreductase n=1 Tax=Gynurincola endophyticus TaxID=2479004 RepID=UPI000F8EFC1D|nr:flavodoxin domain-containing protein [Gynurincola endophyticus]
MLPEPKLNILNDLLRSASKEELIWMNGYMSGLLAQQPAVPVNTVVQTAVKKITIVYGTETGNAKKVATEFASFAKKKGVVAKLQGLDQYKLNDLQKEEYLFAVISTQGDGEAPAGAKKFYDFIHAQPLQLNSLKFGILALGDSSYPLFCKAGEDVDQRLSQLGATAILPLERSDVDFSAVAQKWFDEVLNVLSKQHVVNTPVNTATSIKPKSGKQFYKGTIQQIINLNDRGSAKSTFHIEIAVTNSNIYEVGDSLGVIPKNSVALVREIISLIGVNEEELLDFRGEQFTVGAFLKEKANIVYLSSRVIRQYAAITKQEIPDTRMGLLELLKIYPSNDLSHYCELIKCLEPNAPRLYSISSSPEAHSGEIHLTVALDTFKVNGELKKGLCSAQLSDWKIDETVEFYIQPNHHFKLPDNNRPVIMIGPGTGIAPFRAFLSHRDAIGAEGKNWLFFGEQHFVSDFLYQTEIQNWFDTGLLQSVSVAFSRDQSYKIYVQHRILEHAKEFWQWIEEGAIIYICGAKNPMSTDVLEAIAKVIERFGGKAEAESIQYLDELKSSGRLLLDVY